MMVEFQLNGRQVTAPAEPNTLLLDLLRDHFRLTGAKRSCDVQVCGSCTVLVDGGPVSACTYLACEAAGREVLTIEGFAELPEFERFASAFERHAAVQCGFCTPGFLLTAQALLDRAVPLDRQNLPGLLAGNLCRCTGYQPILDAVLEVYERR
jgi:aerobic carbon-monoxide dehydrogenase small subunit